MWRARDLRPSWSLDRGRRPRVGSGGPEGRHVVHRAGLRRCGHRPNLDGDGAADSAGLLLEAAVHDGRIPTIELAQDRDRAAEPRVLPIADRIALGHVVAMNDHLSSDGVMRNTRLTKRERVEPTPSDYSSNLKRFLHLLSSLWQR